MPQFVYVGDGTRTFPELGIVVEDDDVVDLPANPDPRFFALVTPRTAPVAAESEGGDL